MAKLNLEIIAKEAPWNLLAELAKDKFNAMDIYELEGTKTIAIDGGMNDIRATIVGNSIQFQYRYEKDGSKYEGLILDFCRTNKLVVRFT